MQSNNNDEFKNINTVLTTSFNFFISKVKM